MRRTILATTTGLMLTACAVPQQTTPGAGPDYRGSNGGDWQSGGDRALSAYIVPPEQGGLRFHVNRPAYVAMFEIVPDGGTRLIYPTPGVGRMDGFVFSGRRISDTGGYWRGDGYSGGVYAGRGSAASARLDRPRFLFLIASERPLEVDAFGAYGSGLRAALGHHYYASLNPYATMERIAEVALPTMIDDGTWATDVYVYWPQVLRQYRAGRDVIVRCNGFTMFVAAEYAYQARQALCRDPERDRVAQRPRVTLPPANGDSAEIAQPGRREPLPPADEETRRRLTSSRQLQQPQTQRPDERRTVEERVTAGAAEPTPEQEERERARRPHPGAGTAEPDAPRRGHPGSSTPRPESPRRPQPEAGAPDPEAPRRAQPPERAEPQTPRAVRPAPEPRTPRPVAAEPRRGGGGTPTAGPGETQRPRVTSGGPTPAAARPAGARPAPARPAPASASPATPAPASPPRQSAPATRPTPSPPPAPESGQEAPRKRRGGGGGGGGSGGDGG